MEFWFYRHDKSTGYWLFGAADKKLRKAAQKLNHSVSLSDDDDDELDKWRSMGSSKFEKS